MRKTIYYKDLKNDDFAGTNIETRPLRSDYIYVHRNFFWKIGTFIIYRIIAQPLVTLFTKLVFLQSFKNKRVLKEARGKGMYAYINHTSCLFDAFIPNMLVYHKKGYIVAGPDLMSIKGINNLVEMLGAIPLSSSISQTIQMKKCFETRIKEHSIISFYPEAHIWPYYNKIRPFADDSFFFPSKDGSPVYAVTNCYKKRILGHFPKVVTYVDGPFYRDPDKTTKENMEYLRNCCYNAMMKRSMAESTYEYWHYEESINFSSNTEDEPTNSDNETSQVLRAK